MSSQPDEAPLSVGVHGEHQGQVHAGVAAVEEPGDVPTARPHQLLHAVAEEPGARPGPELGHHAALVPDTLLVLGSGNLLKIQKSIDPMKTIK